MVLSDAEQARYLAAIGCRGPFSPDAANLQALISGHQARFVFENLGPLCNQEVGLDPSTVLTKFLDETRGGYCFEHNSLFYACLRACGYAVEMAEARILVGRTDRPPRTHLCLWVDLEGERFLVDVGFGANAPTRPIPQSGVTVHDGPWQYRLVERGCDRVYQGKNQILGSERWVDLYVITPNVVEAVDLDVANWFTSAHPRSIFRRTLVVHRVLGGVRHILRDLTYLIAKSPDDVVEQRLTPDAALDVITHVFGLRIDAEQAALRRHLEQVVLAALDGTDKPR